MRKMRKICRRSLAVILSLMFLLSSCAKPEYSVYHFETEESGKTAQESEKETEGSTEAPKDESKTSESETSETAAPAPTEEETGTADTEPAGTESTEPSPTEETEETEDGGDGSIFDQLPDDGSDPGGYVVTDGKNTAYQLTEEDIQEMNGNRAVIIRSNDGYVSTLIGKYYDQKINVVPGEMSTFEEGINSLNGIATLLGFRAGTEFFADNGSRDKEGYTYLTYRQKYAGSIVENATLHIILDPEGYTAGVSCSFTPEIGISEEGADIGAEAALEAARNVAESSGYTDLTFYPDYTAKASVPFTSMIYRCYVVVSDNPEKSSGFEFMQYMKFYIASDTGEFLFAMPSTTLSVSVEQDYYPTEEVFDGLEPASYTASIDFMGIGVQEVTINTAYNPSDNLYYMIDLDRKIAIADYDAFMNKNFDLQFYTSTNNTDWDERDVAAMVNYAASYDAYDRIGVPSPDGFNSPILALRHWEENGEPVNNAVFISYIEGWYVFGYSEANNYCYDLDAMGHEYTHAVTMASIAGSNYMNDAGAVNEAYSDVMGNLIEMMAEKTTDTTWELAENSGESLRNMSNPYLFSQHYAIGDLFYVPNTAVPFVYNDQGGVHRNSSIINYAAYLLNTQGMSYEELFDLFYTSMQVLTPVNTFQDVYAALVFSARSNGYTQYESMITEIFIRNGVLSGDRRQAEQSYEVEGCGRITFHVDTSLTNVYGCLCGIGDAESGSSFMTWPDEEGTVSALVPAGSYYFVQFQAMDLNTQQVGTVYYSEASESGWTGDVNYATLFSVEDGGETVLPDIY